MRPQAPGAHGTTSVSPSDPIAARTDVARSKPAPVACPHGRRATVSYLSAGALRPGCDEPGRPGLSAPEMSCTYHWYWSYTGAVLERGMVVNVEVPYYML